ncbi:MAG: hypothetical protein ABSG46_05140 [Candidatus Binataceae bacterium]
MNAPDNLHCIVIIMMTTISGTPTTLLSTAVQNNALIGPLGWI